jgi:hypothetical protein
MVDIGQRIREGNTAVGRKGRSLEHHQRDFVPWPLALQMAFITCRTTIHPHMQERKGNKLVLCHYCDPLC